MYIYCLRDVMLLSSQRCMLQVSAVGEPYDDSGHHSTTLSAWCHLASMRSSATTGAIRELCLDLTDILCSHCLLLSQKTYNRSSGCLLPGS